LINVAFHATSIELDTIYTIEKYYRNYLKTNE